MLKITYDHKNIEGEVVQEIGYFHINETEIQVILAENPAFFDPKRLASMLQRVKSEDSHTARTAQAEMVVFMRELLLYAYGVRDGNDFIRSEDALSRFKNSNRCDAVLRKILSTENDMINFMSNVLPEPMAEKFLEGVNN